MPGMGCTHAGAAAQLHMQPDPVVAVLYATPAQRRAYTGLRSLV